MTRFPVAAVYDRRTKSGLFNTAIKDRRYRTPNSVYLILRRQTRAAAVREEIVALVVHQNERREILHFDFPHGFHAELGILEQLDLLDVLLRENRGRPADAPEIKSAVFLACARDLRAAIALGEHHHRAALRLEEINVAIHAARGRRP